MTDGVDHEARALAGRALTILEMHQNTCLESGKETRQVIREGLEGVKAEIETVHKRISNTSQKLEENTEALRTRHDTDFREMQKEQDERWKALLKTIIVYFSGLIGILMGTIIGGFIYVLKSTGAL